MRAWASWCPRGRVSVERASPARTPAAGVGRGRPGGHLRGVWRVGVRLHSLQTLQRGCKERDDPEIPLLPSQFTRETPGGHVAVHSLRCLLCSGRLGILTVLSLLHSL